VLPAPVQSAPALKVLLPAGDPENARIGWSWTAP